MKTYEHMDCKVSIIPRILQILEIEVSNILYNPGNIENMIFQFSTILEIRAAGGWLQGFCFCVCFFLTLSLEFCDMSNFRKFCFFDVGSFWGRLGPIWGPSWGLFWGPWALLAI